MAPCTASEVVTFAAQLEAASAVMYEAMARKHLNQQAVFNGLATENAKNESFVRRTYYEAVSDALETAFSFDRLTLDDYRIDLGTEDKTYSEDVNMALLAEEETQRFYRTAAEEAGLLLADLHRAFEKMARRRDDRKASLRRLLEPSS